MNSKRIILDKKDVEMLVKAAADYEELYNNSNILTRDIKHISSYIGVKHFAKKLAENFKHCEELTMFMCDSDILVKEKEEREKGKSVVDEFDPSHERNKHNETGLTEEEFRFKATGDEDELHIAFEKDEEEDDEDPYAEHNLDYLRSRI